MKQDAVGLVYAAIDDLNGQVEETAAIGKSPETRLLGGDQGLDSLTFVNLVVAIEDQIRRQGGVSIVLVDEDSMAAQEHPFRTVGSLAAYIETLLAKQTQP